MIIISLFINCISLIADWSLFSFPLNQGLMELSDYKCFVKDFDDSGKSIAKIFQWHWIMPNLKIHFENKSCQKVLKTIIKDDNNFGTTISFTNKATACILLVLAAGLKWSAHLMNFLEEFHLVHFGLRLVGSVIVFKFAGLFSAYYRASSHRQKSILDKFKREE